MSPRLAEPLLDGPGQQEAAVVDLDALPSTSGAISGEAGATADGASVLQATFNLVNIYMGLGLLSQAYTLRMAGWLGLAALAATTLVFWVSAKLLVGCMAKLPPGQAHTYPNLGVKALGRGGKATVALFTCFEFFSGSCITLLVIWREVVDLLPEHGVQGLSPLAAAVAASSACLAPVLLLPSFKVLSYLNLAGCVSTVVVTATVVLAAAADPTRARMPVQPPAGHSLLQVGILQAVGIYALSVSGHSSLPVLRKSMKRPEDFHKVLNTGFGTMFLLYSLVAGCGYYYWGNSAHTLLTADLRSNSRFSGVDLLLPGLTLERLVSACILVNAATTYPNLVLIVQDMVCSVTAIGDFGRSPPPYLLGAAVRLLLFTAGSVLSYSAYRVLGDVMSLSGGFCSVSCSLLLPGLCFLLLHRRDLAGWQVAATLALLALGAALLVSITAHNLRDIIEKSRTRAPAGDLAAALTAWPR